LRVEVEAGQIRRIEAHPDHRATASGVCLKGLSQLERVHAEDRLLYPLRRTCSGAFARISWDEALDRIAEQLHRLAQDPGHQSVLFYTGSGTKGLLNQVSMAFWRLWGGCTTTYGDLCWPAGLEATRLTLGDCIHSAPQDIANARLIILWGKNPAETNIHQMPFIDQGQAAGARLVVIDPRRTESAEGADLLVQVRPGTDGALALGIAHLLISRSWIDQGFIDRHVLGCPELAELAAGFPPARVEELTGVPQATLHQLAELIGTIKPLTICAGFGMQRFTNSGQTVRAIIALLALTGNFGRPGAGWVYANLQSHIFSSPRDPLTFYPPQQPDSWVRVAIPMARLGECMAAASDPPLCMIWVERGNPVTQSPDAARVIQAFRSLDFRVVVDQLMTDTAREADLVLPAKTMFEQTDVINAYWHHSIQIRQKLIEPPGEVKPETEIYYLLARRLGLDPEAIAGVIPEPTDDAIEAYLERRLAAFSGLSLARLRQGPVPAPGAREVAFADLRFPTPSGKIELLSEEAAERWHTDPLPRYTPPVEGPGSDPRYPLHLLTPNTKNRIHSQLNNLPSIRELSPGPEVVLSPADAGPRGIADGDTVTVCNERGSITIDAVLDYSLRPGCVVINNGWWLSQGGAVNLLSLGRETDLGHGAAFHDCMVEVRRAP
jgi:anaerobic selenocysteine-containing dehydrogenase